jgi:hypothetical protein
MCLNILLVRILPQKKQQEVYVQENKVRKFNLFQLPLTSNIYNKIITLCKDVSKVNAKNIWRIYIHISKANV